MAGTEETLLRLPSMSDRCLHEDRDMRGGLASVLMTVAQQTAYKYSYSGVTFIVVMVTSCRLSRVTVTRHGYTLYAASPIGQLFLRLGETGAFWGSINVLILNNNFAKERSLPL